MDEVSELIQRLFRKEFSKIVGVISKVFGLTHIEIAEDIVSETFLTATETWRTNGIPENPSAWLYVVAKQKTLYQFRRSKIFTDKVLPHIRTDEADESDYAIIDFSSENIQDSQLQMMFAVCNPAIASEAQIALALRILCGFGIEEISEAFLTNKETINKRLFRAREKLRSENISLEMPSEPEISNRLDNVLHIIYLLYNEGYYSTTQNQSLRMDLCLEAMRLGMMLIQCPKTNLTKVNALMALMCFHTSRFNARHNSDSDIILYDLQDETLWNTDLILQGNHFLTQAAQGDELSRYHLEAGIAFWHCHKEDTQGKWRNFLQHYDLLLSVNPSTSIFINRAYAFYKVNGAKAALAEIQKIPQVNSHFYFTLLGELYKEVDSNQAKENFKRALSLAKTQTDQQVLKLKIDNLKK